MNKKILAGILVVILLIAGGAFALFGMNEKKASAPSEDMNVPQANDTINNDSVDVNEEATISTAIITFTNEGFIPGSLTVKKGTKVTVQNNSTTRVQFSSDDHPSHRLNTEMNLKTLAAGESASFAAEEVGTHGFHDHIDDSKTGTLIVTE